MCGITGWISYQRDLTHEVRTIERMTETMGCRGPDAEGIYRSEHALIGHRRLAVIDIEGGKQPMTVMTGGHEVTLTYSGEVYNYRQLRAELEGLGVHFDTASDTEVVLRGYLHWGADVAARLVGMFAFAIWDSRTQTLVMIRDRVGVKPLYFHRTHDGVLFGSEQKAILAHPDAPRTVTTDGVREILSYAFTPRHAIWSGLEQVEPGTVVTVNDRGVTESKYWSLTTMPHRDNLSDTVDRVRELFTNAVTDQLEADVPMCLLLSGGIDSSAITAAAAERLGGSQVRTYAVDFQGRTDDFKADELRDTDDAPFVHSVAKHLGTAHSDIVLDSATLSDPTVRRASVVARDAPMGAGDMDFSLHLLFQAIRRESTVALSGESADELFGGYRHMHIPQIQQAHAFPWIAVSVGPFDKDATGIRPDLLKELDLETYRADQLSSALAVVDRDDNESDFEYRMRQIVHLHLTRFMRYLLDRKDRISMANGLEVRVPFCDHRLMEYVYNVPWSMKAYEGAEKYLLRSAVSSLLPSEVVQRPKSPYPSTQDAAYSMALRRQAGDLLADRDHGVFDLVDDEWLGRVARDDGPLDRLDRLGTERALDLAVWIDEFQPALRLS